MHQYSAHVVPGLLADRADMRERCSGPAELRTTAEQLEERLAARMSRRTSWTSPDGLTMGGAGRVGSAARNRR